MTISQDKHQNTTPQVKFLPSLTLESTPPYDKHIRDTGSINPRRKMHVTYDRALSSIQLIEQ